MLVIPSTFPKDQTSGRLKGTLIGVASTAVIRSVFMWEVLLIWLPLLSSSGRQHGTLGHVGYPLAFVAPGQGRDQRIDVPARGATPWPRRPAGESPFPGHRGCGQRLPSLTRSNVVCGAESGWKQLTWCRAPPVRGG